MSAPVKPDAMAEIAVQDFVTLCELFEKAMNNIQSHLKGLSMKRMDATQDILQKGECWEMERYINAEIKTVREWIAKRTAEVEANTKRAGALGSTAGKSEVQGEKAQSFKVSTKPARKKAKKMKKEPGGKPETGIQAVEDKQGQPSNTPEGKERGGPADTPMGRKNPVRAARPPGGSLPKRS